MSETNLTSQELIAKVLELDAKATKGPWEKFEHEVLSPEGFTVAEASFQSSLLPEQHNARLIAHYRTAAPILARICLKLIEQRDHFHAVCYRDLEPALEDESLRKINAELDRIAKGEE